VSLEGDPPDAGVGNVESEEILRAKYFDYCSAQIADILLLLSPDEMYLLAQEAAREVGAPGEIGYGQIVKLATGRVSRKLALPPFEIWVQDYQLNPGRYDQSIIGLWESELPPRLDG